jgi:hypothetical protein
LFLQQLLSQALCPGRIVSGDGGDDVVALIGLAH